MTLLDLISNNRFKGRESLKLIHAYLDDPTEDKRTEVFHSLLPIINVVMRQQYRYLDDIDRDDLAQVGAIDFWDRVQPGKLPRFDNARAIFNYFYKSALHAAHKTRKKQTQKAFEFGDHGLLPPVGSYNMDSPEQRVFVKELPRITYEAATTIFDRKCRFYGDERELIIYFVDCISYSRKISSQEVKNLVKRAADAQFFYDYAEVLCRRALMELKNDGNLASLLADDSHLHDWDFYDTTHKAVHHSKGEGNESLY